MCTWTGAHNHGLIHKALNLDYIILYSEFHSYSVERFPTSYIGLMHRVKTILGTSLCVYMGGIKCSNQMQYVQGY